MNSVEIVHEPEQSRFRAYCDEKAVGVLEYNLDNGTFNITRVFVIPEFRGKGIASQLTSSAEKYASENGYSVTASCSYAQAKLTEV